MYDLLVLNVFTLEASSFCLLDLLKDVQLCGVYARREAAFGNIDHARKVFDMALSSIEGLPLVRSLYLLFCFSKKLTLPVICKCNDLLSGVYTSKWSQIYTGQL